MRLNLWPWAGRNVVVNNNFDGPPPFIGGGCCGGGWMEKLMMFNMFNATMQNMTNNIVNVFGRKQQQPIPYYNPQQPMGFYPGVALSNGAGGYNPYMNDGAGSAADMKNLQTYASAYSKQCKIDPLYNTDGSIKGYLVTGKDGKHTSVDSGDVENLAAKLQELYPDEEEKTEDKTEDKTEVKAKDEVEAKTEPKAEDDAEVKAESKAEEKTEAKTEVKADNSAKTEESNKAEDVKENAEVKTVESKTEPKRKYYKGKAPDGYEWTKYSQLSDNGKKQFKVGMYLGEILKKLALEDNDANRKLLKDANPTAIDDEGKLVNLKKFDLLEKRLQMPNSFVNACKRNSSYGGGVIYKGYSHKDAQSVWNVLPVSEKLAYLQSINK